MTKNDSEKIQISVHITKKVLQQLEKAAEESMRSLSAECAFRLRESLEEKKK